LPKGSPTPTAAQVRAQVWDAVVHGARGIIYFPQQLSEINGFEYDATPADVAAEMTRVNAQLTSIGAALETPIDPPTGGATVAGPLEATWRTYRRRNYYVVFNNSSRSVRRQVTLGGTGGVSAAAVVGEGRNVTVKGGAFTDTFGAYQAHVYVLTPARRR
jgi:hypothetical protein